MGGCVSSRQGFGLDGAILPLGSRLLYREWIEETPQDIPEHSSCNIRVLTWNVLSQQLAKGFDRVNPDVLTWQHRQELLSQALFRTTDFGEPFWDVICL